MIAQKIHKIYLALTHCKANGPVTISQINPTEKEVNERYSLVLVNSIKHKPIWNSFYPV